MRLIDADKALWFVPMNKRIEYAKWIDAQPTVDAVPVIRCKDCEHWQCDDSESYCDELGIFDTDMNSYCSYGKRKDNG